MIIVVPLLLSQLNHVISGAFLQEQSVSGKT